MARPRTTARRRARPSFLFHFTTPDRYDAIVDSCRIEPHPNTSLNEKPGISFTDLDPRTQPWQRISLSNWGAERSWQMKRYVAVPFAKVRRAKRLPRSHEWITTNSVRLDNSCFGGIRRNGDYAADPRIPACADR